MKKIIVVGGGAAGIAAAQGALDAGADSVWLIEIGRASCRERV